MIKANKKTSTRYICVARIFDWRGRPNRKSYVMTSSKFFEKRRIFTGLRYRRMEDQKPGPRLACNLSFARKKRLELKVKKISEIVEVGRRGE